MKFPSTEFNDAIAALCHGNVSEQNLVELHDVLRSDNAARDEYLFQVELHSRLVTSTYSLDRFGDEFERLVFRSDDSRGRSKLRRRRLLICFAAATLMFIPPLLVYYAMTKHRESEARVAVSRDVGSQSSNTKTLVTPQRTTTTPTNSSAIAAGIIRANVRFAFAANAPVMVATGRVEPIRLGAHIPYSEGGDTLHVWNWSKSPLSRVLKDVRLWEHQRFALSPDGRLLVWSNGDILDLETNERSRIDLGGAFYFEGGLGEDEKLRRIQELHFSPDGGRLAVLVSNIDVQPSTHPLRNHDFVRHEIVQIVEFPTAKLLCEFPAGDLLPMRIAFSPNGKRVVSAIPPGELEQQIVERDATTGEILRKYEPHVQGHAYALSISPDENHLAVFDGVGAVLIWDAATGELKHRIDAVRHESFSTVLRFSPDGKFLAVDSVQRVLVIDVSKGELATTFPQSVAGDFRWSPDGETLTVITRHQYGDGDSMAPLCNIFPSVHEWAWRTGTPR